ncbi:MULTISPECIES: sulfurtransferase complex subunit TusB [Glaesserella]|uniref:Sulfurtransferase complex subunit TusB n=1 Tax=Glaesserella australis TaxID=2094024 RepID=A0A328C1K2_9PAST|nr:MULTISPECIES: sulfurtransferase complex subunit TusB [Glaesserella]AUI66743.1 sulfurtransferase complex subunit TusB [Glaesserella sp. 15-184]RAL19795.1 sulfurtransferase complex subunit TusB [Glaesserella australis]
MLYTFSKAQYDSQSLNAILDNITDDDVVVLWQDGVLQAVKSPQLFATKRVFVLQNDVVARALSVSFPMISLSEFVKLSEQHFPQLAF